MTLDTDDLRFEALYGTEFGTRYAWKEPNGDLEGRIHYYHSSEMQYHLHFVAVTPGDERVMAIAAVQQHPYAAGELWLQYVSVAPEYRNHGLARKLFRQAVEYAADQGKTLELSRLSDDGEAYLPNMIREAQRDHPGVLTRIPPDLVIPTDEIDEDVAAPAGP
ncbi:GNAT family N-acetyltransferase [Roseivivax sp. CAU 1761]